MTSVLDPENHSLPKIQDAIQLRKQAVAQKESMIFNELSPARFARGTSLNNMHPRGLDNQQGNDHLFASRRSSMSLILSPPEISRAPSRLAKDLGKEMSILSRRSSTPTLPNLHYASLNCTPLPYQEIKARQAKPFNIISNI
jgi:hypothetical protein